MTYLFTGAPDASIAKEAISVKKKRHQAREQSYRTDSGKRSLSNSPVPISFPMTIARFNVRSVCDRVLLRSGLDQDTSERMRDVATGGRKQ